MSRFAAWFLVALLATAAGSALGQETPRSRSYFPGQKVFGAGVQMSVPYAGFGEDYDTGWGLQAMADAPLMPMFAVVGSVGWNRFAADKLEALDVWQIAFGAKVNIGAFYMGGEAGWFSGLDQWNFVPSLGLRWTRLEIAARWNVSGTSSWTSFRAGYYFF